MIVGVALILSEFKCVDCKFVQGLNDAGHWSKDASVTSAVVCHYMFHKTLKIKKFKFKC